MGKYACAEVIAQTVGRRRFSSARGKRTLVRIARVERRHANHMKRSRQKIYVILVVE